jgi:hypothetical protein
MKLFIRIAIVTILFCLLGRVEAQERGTFFVDFKLNAIYGSMDNNSAYIAINYETSEIMNVLKSQVTPVGSTYTINKSCSFRTNVDDGLIYRISPNNLIYTGVTSGYRFTFPYSSLTNQDIAIRGFGSSANITVQPYALNLYYFDSNGISSSTQDIPSADKITIKATTFDYPSLYKWEYKIDVLGGNSSNWLSIPTTCEKNNRKEITFSGVDILSTLTAFKEMIDQNKYIFIRINSTSKIPGTILRLNPRISAPHIKNISTVSPTCHGGTDGKIEITFDRPVEKDEASVWYRATPVNSGDDLDYYSLSVPMYSDIFSINELKAGNYDIKILGVDNKGIAEFNGGATHKKAGISVNNYDILYVPVTNQVNPKCFKGTGSATVSPTGGAGGYTIKWGDANTSMTRNDLLANVEYRYTVTDQAGCSKDSTVTLSQPTKLTYSVNSTNPTCFSSNNGSISVTPSGGTPPYRIVWTDNASTEMIRTGLSGISYSFTLYDKNDYCSTGSTVPLIAPANLTFSVNSVNPKCSSSNDGTISINPSGGTPPYRIVWTDGSTEMNRTGLSGTSYGFTLYDKNDYCSTDSIVILTAPEDLTFIAKGVNLKCLNSNDGTITITPSGGVPPYTVFYKKNNDPEKSQEVVSDSAIIQNLDPGSYVIRVVGRNTCNSDIKTKTVTITQPDNPLKIKFIESKSCQKFGSLDGTATVEITGGSLSYPGIIWAGIDKAKVTATSLDGNKSTVTGTVGSYNLTVTDSNTCSQQLLNVKIEEPDELKVSVATVKEIKCNTDVGTIVAHGSGGVKMTGVMPYKYEWYDRLKPTEIVSITNDSTFNTNGGTYFVKITDANSINVNSIDCTISKPDELKITLERSDSTSGYGKSNGHAKVCITGGTRNYNLIWSDTSNGRVISSPDSISTDLSDLKKCYSTITNKAGKYKLKVIDDHLCENTLEVNIYEPEQLKAHIHIDSLECRGGDWELKVVVTGGSLPYSYKWYKKKDGIDTEKGTADILICNEGDYRVIASDIKGNSANDEVNLTDPAILNVDIRSTLIKCVGGKVDSIVAEPTGGISPYKYKWNTGQTTRKIENALSGTYSVTVTDKLGCVKDTSITLTDPPQITLTYDSTNISCNGSSNGKVTIKAQGGSKSYVLLYKSDIDPIFKKQSKYFGKDTTIVDLKKDKYYFSVEDSNGCSSGTVKVNIDEPPAIQIDSIDSRQPKGYGLKNGWVKVSVKGGDQFKSLNPYTSKWIDSHGLQLISNDTLSADKKILFSTIKNIGSDKYTLNVGDSNSCPKFETISIGQPDLLEVSVQIDRIIKCKGEYGTLVAHAKGGVKRLPANLLPYTYEWYNYSDPTTVISTGNDSTFTCIKGEYFVKVKDINDNEAISAKLPISEPNLLTIDSIVSIPTTCYGKTDGSAKVKIMGGTRNYKLSWSEASSGRVISSPDSIVTDLPNPQECYSTITNRAGKYKLDVTDANSCFQALTVTISQPDSLDIKIKIDSVKCHGGNWTIRAKAKGGVAFEKPNPLPYHYEWYEKKSTGNSQKLSSTDSILVCKAGNYFVKIIDKNLNQKLMSFNLEDPSVLSVSLVKTDIQCHGDSIGSVEAIPTGGTAPYSYLWGKGETTKKLEHLKSGTYSVTVTDSHGCSALGNIDINESKALKATLYRSSDISCNGSDNGIITIKGEGGSGSYKLRYKSDNSPVWKYTSEGFSPDTIRIEGLKKDKYYLTIQDSYVCNTSDTIVVDIKEPSAIQIDSIAAQQPKAKNGTNGWIKLGIKGGTFISPQTLYKIKWSYTNGDQIPFASNDTLTNDTTLFTTMKNIGAGKYTLSVTDANNCPSSKDIIIGEPDLLEVTVNIFDSISCNGESGTLVAKATGGVRFKGLKKPYIYEWYGNAEKTKILQSGNDSTFKCISNDYFVIVKDSNEIKATSEIINLPQPNKLTATINTTDVSETSENDGSLKAIVTGGTPPYKYLCNKIETTAITDGLKAGIYDVLVTDLNLCSVEVKDIKINKNCGTYFGMNAVNPGCTGGTDGKITIIPIDKTWKYKLVYWSQKDTIKKETKEFTGEITITDLVADNYTLKLIGSGCEPEKYIQLLDPSAINISTVDLKAARKHGTADGSVKVSVSGGTPIADTGYTLNWTDSQGIVASTELLSADKKTLYSTIQKCKAGEYTLLVTDAHNCTSTYKATINQPDSLILNPLNESKKIQINGERASVTASAIGGQRPYQFIWYKISQNDTTVVYTDLQNESSTLSLLAGKYYVKVVDDNKNEVSSGAYLITQPDPISIHFQAKDVDCYGSNTGRIVATISGGVAPYTVNGQLLAANTFVLDGLASADYKVTAVDKYSAIMSGSAKVGHPNDVKVSLIQKNPICAGSNTGEIQILSTGGRGSYKLTYWSDKDKTKKVVSNFKSTTITGLNMDKYYLQVEDSVGCKSTSEPIKTTNLVDPSVVTISFQGTTAATGYGLANGTAKFSIEGGTPYSTPNAPYILKWFGEDGNEIEPGNIYNSILNGKMYTEIRNVKGGLYSLVVKDVNACVGSSPVKISQPNALQVTVKTQSIIHCYDETGKLEATALGGVQLSNTALPYIFSWFKKTSSGVDVDLNWHGNSIDNCKAGDYFVRIKDANGNEASCPLYILTQPEPLSTVFEVSDVYCVGSNSGQIVTKPSGGTPPYKYAWTNTSNTTNKLEKLIVGTYSVTITDDLGCSITKAAAIKQQPSMQVDVKLTHPTCDKGDDGKIEVLSSGGLPPYTIKWSDGQNQTLKTGLKAGVHEFTVTDNSGCWNTYTQTLINPAPVIVNLGSKVTLCQGQALTQNITLPNDAGAQYQWSDAAGVSHRTSDMLLSDPGTYTATITTSKGCIGSSSILVERSDKVLEADFMMASKAALGNSVEIINITYPMPNSASWIIPESSNITVVENTESKLTLQFSELGEYTIGIKTKEGNCEKMLYKNIKIVDQSEMADYKEGKEALIKKFIVSPNPTKGDFKVGVEFSEKIDAVLLLIDSDSGKIIERRELSNSDWYEAPFNVSMPAGNYMIHLVCTKAQANFKFLIKSSAY